ncbi:MAG: nucleotidyltransferase family protein [Verrucomicrobiota bacterium]
MKKQGDTRSSEVPGAESASNGLGLGVVILAAGSSRRMGKPKLLLPWGETTVLGQLLRQWNALGAAQIAIVSSSTATHLEPELERLQFSSANRIQNAASDQGMFSSVRAAAQWNGWSAGLTHWAIVLGDQPHLKLETLRDLIGFGAGQPEKICQPLRNGRGRHPVLLPRRQFLELGKTEATDLKAFLVSKANELAGFEADDAGLDLDIDTPEDYERARQHFFSAD